MTLPVSPRKTGDRGIENNNGARRTGSPSHSQGHGTVVPVAFGSRKAAFRLALRELAGTIDTAIEQMSVVP